MIMAKPTCEIYYNRKSISLHVRQIYTGFCELAARNVIDIKFTEHDWNQNYKTENLVKVCVNGAVDVIYDTNDGLYWVYGNAEDNLKYFTEVILPQCTFLFKRSYKLELSDIARSYNCNVMPLGFNYDVTSTLNIIDRVCYNRRDKVKRFIGSSKALSGLLKREHEHVFIYQNYECVPDMARDYTDGRILFLTRLWDPEDRGLELETSSMKAQVNEERKRINVTRIECIEACKKHFGGRFIGGLSNDPYSMKVAPQLIASKDLTRKSKFLTLIKSSSICIGTTGLHDSIGWKFAEYVAASRAIVTEKLCYEVPGQFKRGYNYLEFSTADELKMQIEYLTDNPSVINNIMWNNYEYYNNYLRPDNLILNTLRAVLA